MNDSTEGARRVQQAAANALPDEALKGAETWDTEALQRDFEVIGFLAPYVVVVRRSDGVRGTLCFRHHPRVYFDFRPER